MVVLGQRNLVVIAAMIAGGHNNGAWLHRYPRDQAFGGL